MTTWPGCRDQGRCAIAGCVARATRSRRRSEERRVGKECRSLCDWSSDVCSSDLIDEVMTALDDHMAWMQGSGALRDRRVRRAGDEIEAKIGRASCRERV